MGGFGVVVVGGGCLFPASPDLGGIAYVKK